MSNESLNQNVVECAQDHAGVRFRWTRPDGTKVIVTIDPELVDRDDGSTEFRLRIKNGPPRGGETFWTVSRVLPRG